jgi:tRNA G18 (ribose-2'-O)-methylase SpoU
MSTSKRANKPKTPDGRNIIDHFWYWKDEAIKAELNSNRFPFAILVSNLFIDFNIGQVIRNSNALLAKEFFYYGRHKFDKRGAVGMHHYERITWLPTEEDLNKIQDYTWIGIDNIPGAVPIDEFEWPEKPLMCFGQEQVGLPDEIKNRCQSLVYIRQYGCVRSLNVGCASAIAFYDYVTKYWKKHPELSQK